MQPQVTEEDIDSFHSGYRGSEEERAQVLKYYRQFKGDMRQVQHPCWLHSVLRRLQIGGKCHWYVESWQARPRQTTPPACLALPRQVFGWVMCSDEAADAHRFMDLLDAAIQAKEAPSFPKYAAWAKKVAAKPRPAEGAAQGSQAKAKGRGKGQQQGAEAALVAQIRGRQQRALTVPAGGVLGRLMAEMENSEPSEEDFQKARQRLNQKRAGGKPQKNKAAGAAASGSGSKRAKR